MTGEQIDAKLERHEQYAAQAVAELVAWLQDHPQDLIAVARGRHVTGHLLYGDRNYAEWDRDRLRKEIAEELADAINYGVRLIHLRSS
jgi:hemerythrin